MLVRSEEIDVDFQRRQHNGSVLQATYIDGMVDVRDKQEHCLHDACTNKPSYNRKFRKNKGKHKKECSGADAHGGCFQDLEICEINFAQGI